MTEEQVEGVTVYLHDDETPQMNFPQAWKYQVHDEGHLTLSDSDSYFVATFRPGLWTYVVTERFR